MDLLGLGTSLWAAIEMNSYYSNYDNPNDGSDLEFEKEVVMACLVISIIITILYAGTVVLGFLGYKRRNVNNLRCFSILMIIWIIADLILVLITMGSLFYSLIIPFVLSIILVRKAIKMRSLILSKLF